MRFRVALLVLVAVAVFGGSYAIGRADRPSEREEADAPVTGERAPSPRRVPVPAAARLPSLRAKDPAPARAGAAPRPAPRRAVGRAAPAPSPAPRPRPRPNPEPGTPFFNKE